MIFIYMLYDVFLVGQLRVLVLIKILFAQRLLQEHGQGCKMCHIQ